MNEDWEEILRHSRELYDVFPEGLAFIGGVAVCAHTQAHHTLKKYTAFSHDGDLVIARADFMDLRDIEVVTSNRRLNKHEFRRGKLQFDVYEEGSSGLIVPVSEILASSNSKEGLRIACVEHLLALKLEAYKDRRATPKGEKITADAFRIVLLSSEAELSRMRLLYLTDEHVGHLEEIRRAPTALRLARGDARIADDLNRSYDEGHARIISVRDGRGRKPTPGGRRAEEAPAEKDELLSGPFLLGERGDGRRLDFATLCSNAGMRNVVTTTTPPDVRLHDEAEDWILALPGRRAYLMAERRLPVDRSDRARAILGRLAYGAHDWAAREVVLAHRRRQREEGAATETSDDVERRRLMAETLTMRRMLRRSPGATDRDIAAELGVDASIVRARRLMILDLAAA